MKKKIVRIILCSLLVFLAGSKNLFAQFGASYSSSDIQQTLLPRSPEAEALGKFGEIPVGLYTGVPNISIPIYEMKMKGVSIPISLDYHSAGAKVDEAASNVGLDWVLNAGGVINQIMYGISDLSNGGWPNSSPKTPLSIDAINMSFSGHYDSWGNDPDYLFCTAAAKEQNDTQPDVFMFNFLGRSGRFFFDQNRGIHLMPFQNLKIEYSSQVSGSPAYTFIITDEHGNKYYFYDMESSFTTTQTCGGTQHSPQALVSIYLSKIVSAIGQEIDFQYEGIGYNIQNQILETRYWIDNSQLPQNQQANSLPTCIRHSSTSILGVRIKSITNVTTNEKVMFTYSNTDRKDLPGTNALSSIEVTNSNNTVIKHVDLLQDYFYSGLTTSTSSLDYRLKLTGIQQSGDQPYSFTYNSIQLPPRLSFSQDHWGYYNGAANTTLLPNENSISFNTGADRSPNENNMQAGILTQITYPTGGTTSFSYEGNTIYNQQNTLAGGLRIKTITDDPINGVQKIKHFEYVSTNNPAQSSGKVQFTPSYDFDYFKYQINQNDGNGSIVIKCDYKAQNSGSVSPLGTLQGGNVVYSNVNCYLNDKTNGYISNQFYTSFDITNRPYVPPFPPPTIIDWLNGLPILTATYKYSSASNSYFPIAQNIKNYKTAIGEQTQDYLNTGSDPNTNESYVTGMKIEFKLPEWDAPFISNYLPDTYDLSLPAVFTYGYYYLYSSWYHLDQEQNIIYDASGQNPVTTTTNYYYDNPKHIQTTRTVTTNSDGKIITTLNTYPDDYISGNTFIDDMKTNHLTGIPIEQVKYETIDNNVSIVSGTINQYLNGGQGLTDRIFAVETANPIPLINFKFSNTAAGQLPALNSQSTYVIDSHYNPRVVYDSYDLAGNPLGFHLITGAAISYKWGYNKQYLLAQFMNAKSNDTFYEGFEDGNGNNNDAKTGHYSHTGSYPITLNGLDNGSYILSYWQKTGSIWSLILNSVIINTGSYSTTLTTQVDDVCFYPVNAQINTYTYDPLIGMTSSTDAKGQVNYYEYDSFQRLINVKDKDSNVTKHIDYHYQGQ